jgi:hypothetical protein
MSPSCSNPYVNQIGFEHRGVQLSDPPTPQLYPDSQEYYHDPTSNCFNHTEERFDHNFDNNHAIPSGVYKGDENADYTSTGFSGAEIDQRESTAAAAQRPPPCSVSFWAVQPSSMKASSSDSGVREAFDRLAVSDSNVTSQSPKVPKIITQDISGPGSADCVGTSGSPHTPTSDSAFLRPPGQTDNFWGERPPVELMQKYLDKYFSGHDLDKEIIVETPVAPVNEVSGQQNTIPHLNRQPLRHKKSIRVVAKEASRKWGQNNAPAGPVLRRKSTKMWGQRVVEVKPGQSAETPTVERSLGYFSKSDALGK